MEGTPQPLADPKATQQAWIRPSASGRILTRPAPGPIPAGAGEPLGWAEDAGEVLRQSRPARGPGLL